MYRTFLNVMIDIYDDSFFEQLDGVANALDNIDASKSCVLSFLYFDCMKFHRLIIKCNYHYWSYVIHRFTLLRTG